MMLPERLVVGELRGSEVLALARAINNGHDGSMASIHATSPRDALRRLELIAITAEPALPLRAVRHELASALQLIVQHSRMADGARRMVSLAEVVGMEGETIALREIFRFEAGERGPDGRIAGAFLARGHAPSFLAKLEGYSLPAPASALPDAALDGQLAPMAMLMAELLRAGYSFVQSVGILAQELPPPVGATLTAVAQAIGAGRPVGEALEEQAHQSRSPFLQQIVGAILRQRSEGGNLADTLAALIERLPGPADDPALAAAVARVRDQCGLQADA